MVRIVEDEPDWHFILRTEPITIQKRRRERSDFTCSANKAPILIKFIAEAIRIKFCKSMSHNSAFCTSANRCPITLLSVLPRDGFRGPSIAEAIRIKSQTNETVSPS
uniref:Uncharacterized protein n=1 Tax=Steinernema glaseri TaxID=37863 RepID=A0A1I7YRQ4_9BILA